MGHDYGRTSHEHHATIDSADTHAVATIRLEGHDLYYVNEIRELVDESDVDPDDVVTYALGKTVEQLRESDDTGSDDARPDGGDDARRTAYGRRVESSDVDDLTRWDGWHDR